MILSTEQADSRLRDPENLAVQFSSSSVEHVPHRRRTPRPTRLPAAMRQDIASDSLAKVPREEIAETYGVTMATVTNIKNGAVASGKADVIRAAHDVAFDRLMVSLGFMTDDKMSGCSARDLSGIAANLSRVVEKTTPRESSDERVKLVVYVPSLKTEEQYRTIDI